MTFASDTDISRFELAVRKFLAFERAGGRAQQLSRYCEVLRKALDLGQVSAETAGDVAVLNRLVQVGLLRAQRNVIVTSAGIRGMQTAHVPLAIPEVSPPTSDWLFRPFGSHEILRFYAMRSAGVGWIMRELEQQVPISRQAADREGLNHVMRNTALLGQIWRICLHYELTEIDGTGSGAPDLDFDPEPPHDTESLSAVCKEKLGLAHLPNVFQLRHIKATCHYHRKSANW